MKKNQIAVIALTFMLINGCDLPYALNTTLPGSEQNDTSTVRAALIPGANGQELRILQIEQLPAAFRAATSLTAILDNSNTTYTVTRNADGSLSLKLPAGRRPDSEGIIELLLSNGTISRLIRFNTGPILTLASPPLDISPASQVTLGTRLQLKARFETELDLSKYSFNWSAATSLQGPFSPISGSGDEVDWTPTQAGNYYLRIDFRELSSGASSSFTTSSPVVFVGTADSIAISTPADGRIVIGDEIKLKANLAERDQSAALLWAYAQNPAGPFQPIAKQGPEIVWEPPLPGAYYLRLQSQLNGRTSTFVSTRPLVQVSPADDVFITEPEAGDITRGQSIVLRATIPGELTDTRYVWFVSPSPQGPFQAIAGNSSSIKWTPDQTGEFYLRVRASAGDKERTFTSSEVKVVVRDSDLGFLLNPQPANLIKGQSVLLNLTDLDSESQINWFFSPSPQAPFQPIAGTGQNLRWSPPVAGSFYLRAEITGAAQTKTTRTSASALVNVRDSANAIQASSAVVALGRSVDLRAQLPEVKGDEQYTWSVGPSAAGPWELAQTLGPDSAASINWYPPREGNYFVKADLYKPSSSEVLSFVSPQALVFVNNTPNFLTTNPNPAFIGQLGAVELTTFLQPPADQRFTYAWSASQSPSGPYQALGASLNLRFTWIAPGTPGAYYIKLDAISESSQRVLSFFSTNPLVFVGESQTQTTTPRF